MYRQAAQRFAGGCLMIVRQKDEHGVEFLGSGFLCHEKGYVLTAAHNISLADKLKATILPPADQFNPVTMDRVNVLDLTVAQHDPANDVALLKIVTPPPISVAKDSLGNEEAVMVGSSACYLGFPYAQSGLHSLKIGGSVISAKVISTTGCRQLQFDANVHEGNSGGPLIDLNSGQIVGIVSGRFSPTGSGGMVRIGNHSLGTDSTISYASGISYAKALLKAEGING